MKRLQVVTVGSEMTLGLRVDSNAARLCRVLGELGYECIKVTTVPDDRALVVAAVSEATRGADLVVVTGGLGPTDDDITRDALADMLHVPLVVQKDVATLLERRYGKAVASHRSVKRQTFVPEGADVILPEVGSAPGLDMRAGDARVIALPGVPSEMQEMLTRLRESLCVSDGSVHVVRSIRTCGRGETEIEDRIRDLVAAPDSPVVTLLAGPGEVEIVLVGSAATREAAKGRLRELEASIVTRLGTDVFGFDDDSLEAQVGSLLAQDGLSLAVAESCTGGAIAKRVTGVPGSSRYFLGGMVAYSNSAKESLLGVDREILVRDGAVSAPAALEMERGVRVAFGSDIGLAATGIAGPTGGTPDKPVGLVYVAAGDRHRTRCREYDFRGSRQVIVQRTTQAALCLLRAVLLDFEEE